MSKLLLFGQPSCMPCQTVKGVLPTLGLEFDYIDVTEEPELAGKYMVMSTPTMVKLTGEDVVEVAVGQQKVMELADKELNS